MHVRLGRVLVSAPSQRESHPEGWLRSAGALIGLGAAFGRGPWHSVTALGTAELCLLPASTVKREGSTAQGAAVLLQAALEDAADCHDARQRLVGSAVARVARALVDNPNELRGLACHVCATMLGMRPETFSRALTTLRRSRAIKSGPELEILDLERLRALAAGR